ncbi:hypothetical protein [Sphingosinicella sp. BN140058]|uniref:hypothetical protein n=1 Tax=Sphingosinicella sp. BN140058 TaxID=1892855 RepID=UPI00101241D3|nr:hypothetical protein [Sphingosinicella sp. BN140058]QAY77053.1 hypothetical protein ETR14_11510 [Sphingosinicella sp. BN140058]
MALLLPVMGFLGWQVVKTAAVAELGPRTPAAAAAVAPGNPEVRLSLALLELRLNGGRVSQPTTAAALQALSRYPIAEEPFLISAIGAIAKGDTTRGENLLVEARRRNPRSRLTRLLLLDRYMRTGRTAQATLEISALNSLVPRTGEVLVPELARMATIPEQQQTVQTVLARDPKLLDAVLARLAGTGADPDLILRLAGPSRRGTMQDGSWQAIMVRELVNRGDLARAFSLWQTFTGVSTDANMNGVYDGAFSGLAGVAPFNWALGASADGVAERIAGGGLEVTYYGRGRTDLARQLVMLRSGRYRLQFRADGDASGQGSSIVWQVRCRENNAAILDLPIAKVTSTPRPFAADFVVPAGCGGQWVVLVGMPAEFPTEQTVVIRDLQIARAG